MLFPVSPTIIAPQPASSPELESLHHNVRQRYNDESNHLQLQRHQNWPQQPQRQVPVQQQFVTKTVSGFMDFVTTVGNTVMVFTPAGLGGGHPNSEQKFTRTRNPTGSL